MIGLTSLDGLARLAYLTASSFNFSESFGWSDKATVSALFHWFEGQFDG